MAEGRWGSEHWPTEIRVKRATRELEIDFDNGVTFTYPAELLRVESPSAEVQGHNPTQKTIVAGKRHVGIVEVEPVGHYAVRIRFDDGHSTGIYSWAYLYEMGETRDNLQAAYLGALAAKGLARE
ncbi:MAG: DUF971 domain-containing protein [Rhodospirillaceae bacterium]|nr:DUF971 domain-containing protein [Rhodospirillaceae bacterium]